MKKKDYLLFDENTTAIIYGNQQKAIQRMLDFDYMCRKDRPSVAAVVNPTGPEKFIMKLFFGHKEMIFNVYNNLEDAAQQHPESDVVINFASHRSAYETSRHALELQNIRTLVIIAEGVPERQSRHLSLLAKKLGKWIIGPATVGGFVPGKFKIANAGGAVSNLVESRLYKPGSVGFVSKSGGMLNEMANIIAKYTDGINEGIAVGGDAFPGSSMLDHLIRYENNPEIKMIVMLGEVGGKEEYRVVNAIDEGILTKPVVAWVTGTCAKVFPAQVQFGHAGAMVRQEAESADAKNKALKKAGALVPQSFDDFGEIIGKTFEQFKSFSDAIAEILPRSIPQEVNHSETRISTSIISSICDERKEELNYAGVPISTIIEENYRIGDIISLLWFKQRLPEYVADFFELALKLTADHGPCVSGAHNAIVTARAGKDLTAALASGLLTIGPRFGGAIDGAAKYFRGAIEKGLSPSEFICEMKLMGTNIPGIGHKIKSVKNPDARVTLLKKWAFDHLPETKTLNFALEVEQLTTSKKGNLILNVDGGIGILFVDMIKSTGLFSNKDIDDIIESGTLNALFVLGRSIGIIGHYLDQKRLRQGLYRHPWTDVCYMTPEAC